MRRKYLASLPTTLLMVALCAGACKYDEKKYRTPTESDDGFLQVTAASTSLPADGFSTLVLTARVAADAVQKQIKFTASLGQLIGGTGTPSTLTVAADATGVARATLKSSQDIGISRITVEVVGVPSVTQTFQVTFEAPDPNSVLQVTADSTSLPADGFSTTFLTARVAAVAVQKQIKFTASLGQLIGGTGTPSTLTVTADATGVARATLKSSQDIGISRITVEVVGVPSATQTLQVTFEAPDPNSVLRFVTLPSNALADGTTAWPITVAVGAGLPGGAGRKVIMTTNLGSFSPTAQVSSFEVTPSQVDNTATVLLYSPQDVGLAVLGAEVAGVKRTTVVSFDRALPDRIRVDLNALSVPNSPNSTLTITAVLTRQTGKVSRQTRAIFDAKLKNGTSFGRFLTQNPLTDADGKVTATFSPAGNGIPGEEAKIVVTDEEGDVTGEASFQVTAPPPGG